MLLHATEVQNNYVFSTCIFQPRSFSLPVCDDVTDQPLCVYPPSESENHTSHSSQQ